MGYGSSETLAVKPRRRHHRLHRALFHTADLDPGGDPPLTGYLGGAMTCMRIGSPLFSHTLFGFYLGLMVWGGRNCVTRTSAVNDPVLPLTWCSDIPELRVNRSGNVTVIAVILAIAIAIVLILAR